MLCAPNARYQFVVMKLMSLVLYGWRQPGGRMEKCSHFPLHEEKTSGSTEKHVSVTVPVRFYVRVTGGIEPLVEVN